MRLVECVPNFSEGRDRAVIDSITSAIEETEGAYLLDVDPGKDTNRTVVTFVAEFSAAVEAAFRAIETASRLIDMSKHQGAHARLGATDVCPFVPVRGVTMEDCVQLANELGARVGNELRIPVYLYESAAKKEDRRNLATVRAGEYEGLSVKLKDPEWKPDYGPAVFNAKTGATIVGARKFLIAYNVNLNTKDRKIAHDIALTIREAGRAKRDGAGKMVRDAQGNVVKVPGTLNALKAVGWYIEEYNRAQVSINLVDYDVTPPHVAFDEVKQQAELRGARVTGSELVGLIPLQAVLQAGRHYLDLQGKSTGVPEKEIIETAVQSLGLNDITRFDPQQKIIEYRVAEKTPLADLAIKDFLDVTSIDTPVPGGGSVSALIASLASALASMVANLTVGKKGYESVEGQMKEVAVKAQALKSAFLQGVDEDSKAFDRVMEAMRLPKKTEEDRQRRDEMVEAATKRAVDVPMGVITACLRAVEVVEAVARSGNVNSLSDAGVAALSLRAAAEGALFNVLINLPGISDAEYVKETHRDAISTAGEVDARCQEVVKKVREELNRPLA
ncbi:MAG: glutamate formimidoyltransferase [Candidatus Latescibacteria bacterium]|nr:glutamate formimidoyltransferase [Candidatus Latescibacterota bacterium]NIM22301.1 glutamate formimidoyltransferase [Candidatus Latescibacterota bacterium]NIM66130.1 glutamate formimidoyltransferase [Candidatus Latescibacterota bacterium]NIO02538.1 glutamate formimidoyltransferase [Candidatus Latescibacterota bacterium]NIO29452.1 glutamate formimidoyltransferase [Candidatus Latescibacterota bacterium]